MVEILDRIYEVFAQLEEVKKTGNPTLIKEKEKELDSLRKELSTASKYKGSYGTSSVYSSGR